MVLENKQGEHPPLIRSNEMGAETFILGAGFSRAISDSMPLVTDLVEPLDDFLAGRGALGLPHFPSSRISRSS